MTKDGHGAGNMVGFSDEIDIIPRQHLIVG